MALQVWLPLNGNLNNQGLWNTTFTNDNMTTITSSTGKVTSNCYQRATKLTNGLIKSSRTINLNNDFSMCCWAYVIDTVGDTANGLISNHSHADNTGCGITVKQVSTSDYRISCNTGNGSVRTYNTYYGKTNIKNAWHHLCLTYNKVTKVLRLFVDGIEEYTLTNYTNASKSDYILLFDWSTTFTPNSYRPACKLNDVRIYDHCLSQKEVKELSKGLCLHYKLSRCGENLLTNSIGEFSGNNTSTSSYKDFKSWSNIVTPESDSWYTTSFDLKGNINGSYFYQYLFNNSTGRQCDKSILYINGKLIGNYTSGDGNTGLIPVTTDWKHIEIVRHFNTNTTALAKTLLFRIKTGTNYTVYIRNIKLEKGDHATPWIPNKSDALYSQLGYNDIEPDCSGYGNDGTISGTLTYSNDTPRYEGSSYLTDSKSCIKIGDLSKISPSGIFTFNIWFKKLTGIWSSKTWETILGGPSGFEIESKLGSTTNNYIHPYNWGGGSVAAPNSYSIPYNLDTWNMLTMVRTASDTKFYLNGELKVTGTAGTIPSGDYFLGAWRDSVSQNYRGILSDARIYATALSAEDIKALYNTPISIDNSKNLHCMELEQTNNQTSFCKSGVAKMELLPIPTITERCAGNNSAKHLKIWANGSQLKLNDVHKIRVIFRSRGDGTPTSSKCSSIHASVYETSWEWSIAIIWNSSATAYDNIGKIQDQTGSFTVNSTITSTTTNIAITLYWLIQLYYGNGSDNQTHDLYYYKYWNATTGEVYAEGGTPEYDRITTNDIMEN